MDIKRMRSIYQKINDNIASEEEKQFFLKTIMELGGMSIEWFYSNLIGDIEEPSEKELSDFNRLIEDLFKE